MGKCWNLTCSSPEYQTERWDRRVYMQYLYAVVQNVLRTAPCCQMYDIMKCFVSIIILKPDCSKFINLSKYPAHFCSINTFLYSFFQSCFQILFVDSYLKWFLSCREYMGVLHGFNFSYILCYIEILRATDYFNVFMDVHCSLFTH